MINYFDILEKTWRDKFEKPESLYFIPISKVDFEYRFQEILEVIRCPLYLNNATVKINLSQNKSIPLSINTCEQVNDCIEIIKYLWKNI